MEEPEMKTAYLIPRKITAPNSLDEFVDTVKRLQKEFNATDDMTICAIVTFTVLDET